MATTFKTFLSNDVTTTRTLLHEAIPITGSIVSGTYADNNIKNFGHGIFQSVYDYPYLSSSANHILDVTCGYASISALSGTSARNQQVKKINMYNQMAQVLAGHDHEGSIRLFDQDGDLTGGTKHTECFFINLSRLLTKDEIKKGSVSLTLATGSTPANADTIKAGTVTIQDTGGNDDFRVNSPAGEYGILRVASITPNTSQVDGEIRHRLYTDTPQGGTNDVHPTGSMNVGLIYYQAGIMVLTASIFGSGSNATDGFGPITDPNLGPAYATLQPSTGSVITALTGSTIAECADGFRNRIRNLQFNNTTELNSTIYFCRANHNDFNYSSNPTYLENSKLVVKNKQEDAPVSYITTVGLYSADNELLAVAKLSEPLKKTPDTELTIRTRLDY